MKIYQPSKNTAPKLISILPFGFGLFAFLLPGVRSDNYFLIAVGILLVLLGVATFLAVAERFIDTETGLVVKRKKWLFINLREEIPLQQFKYVCVIENSEFHSGEIGEGGGSHTQRFYDVNLVGKYSSSDHSGGFETSMFLGRYPWNEEGKGQAVEFGGVVASQVGLPLHTEEYF